MSVRSFVVITALAGSSLGLPWYLAKGNESLPKTSVIENHNSPQEPTTVVKGECKVISLPDEIEKFLKEKHKDRESYISVSCSNTDVKNSYIPLPSRWTGLFPKFVLSEGLKGGGEAKFEMKTEVQQAEGPTGSSMEATFSGEGLKSTTIGTWRGIEKTQFQTPLKDELVSVTIEEKNVIYLFLPSVATANEIYR